MKKIFKLDSTLEEIKLKTKASKLGKLFPDKSGFVEVAVYVNPNTMEWVIENRTVPLVPLHGTVIDLNAFIKLHSRIVSQHKRASTYIRTNNKRLTILRNKYNKLKEELL